MEQYSTSSYDDYESQGGAKTSHGRVNTHSGGQSSGIAALKSIISLKGSKKDPDLANESKDVLQHYPFVKTLDESQPIKSRFRATMRTINDFNDPYNL